MRSTTFWSRGTASAAVMLSLTLVSLPGYGRTRTTRHTTAKHAAKHEAATPCSTRKFAPLTKIEMHRQIRSVAPLDPPESGKNLRLDGVTTLHVAFGETGKVECVSVVKGQSPAAEAIAKSVKDWKFKPYRDKGRLRAAAGDLTIKYHLRDQGSTASVE